jgi:DNA excision repair protein ERCC-2
MAVVVDLEKRTINASIRDLAEYFSESARSYSWLWQIRAELGSRVHSEYQQQRQLEYDEDQFQPEAAVDRTLELAGYQVRLRGRIDGLLTEGQETIVEEVKSVTLGAAELARMRSDQFPEYCLQLRLYALAYAREKSPDSLRGKLILVSLLDQHRQEYEIGINLRAIEDQLSDLVEKIVEDQKAKKEKAARLNRLADELKFPYQQMRQYQDQLIETIQSGMMAGRPVLAMAPTGIGKTVSALLAGLRSALKKNCQLVFLTSKTTQQRLVAETFEQICLGSKIEFGALRGLTLRAKEKMCPAKDMLCHPELCSLLHDFYGRLKKSKAIENLLESGPHVEPETIYAVGQAHKLCPFALSLKFVEEVQLVICDYNYVYDPAVSLKQWFDEQDGRQIMVIIDEAHNLFDRARSYYSPSFNRSMLRSLIRRLQDDEFSAVADAARQMQFSELICSIEGPKLFEDLAELCHQLDDYIDRCLQSADEKETVFVSGQSKKSLIPNPRLEDWQEFGERATALLLSYVLYNRINGLVHADDPIFELLATVTQMRDLIQLQERELVFYVDGSKSPRGPGLGMICVNPAKRLKQRHDKVIATQAMSATLYPLNYYSDCLGFNELDPVLVSMPSPFPKENFKVWVDPSISTAFRDRDLYYDAIARIIERAIAIEKGCYAVYFPSFKFLTSVQACLKLPSENVIVQLPGSTDAQRNRLLAKLKKSNGPMLLLAVMGGVFAEGVDLPGSDLIGAFIVGPGLPQIGFERSVMQQYFEEYYEQGFGYSMLYPGMQRVIQAAGRVIRTPEDKGLVVLLDRRFADQEYMDCFPEHWYQYRPEELICDDLYEAIKEFWKS